MSSNDKKDMTPKESPMKPGEKGFAIFLLIIGLFFTWQSWLLYKNDPTPSSYGAVPLFCSLLIVIFSIIIFISDWKKASENQGKSVGEAFKTFGKYLFPFDVSIMILFMIVYCAALYMGLGFMIITPVFLWVSMTFLSRGNYVKNILWTAVCMAFIYLVFRMLFSVVLP